VTTLKFNISLSGAERDPERLYLPSANFYSRPIADILEPD